MKSSKLSVGQQNSVFILLPLCAPFLRVLRAKLLGSCEFRRNEFVPFVVNLLLFPPYRTGVTVNTPVSRFTLIVRPVPLPPSRGTDQPLMIISFTASVRSEAKDVNGACLPYCATDLPLWVSDTSLTPYSLNIMTNVTFSLQNPTPTQYMGKE